MLDDGSDEHDPVLIPRGASVSDDAWRVSTPATVGDDCRLHGNIRAKSLEVGRDTVVFGSLRAKDDIVVGRGTEIKGDVTTRSGTVRVGPGAKVWGDISGTTVELHENATVDGTIRASEEMRMHTETVLDRPDESAAAMAEMAESLEADTDTTEPAIERSDSDDTEPAADTADDNPATVDSATTDDGDTDGATSSDTSEDSPDVEEAAESAE